jgi:hypothetical protein
MLFLSRLLRFVVCGNSSFANEYRQGCRGNVVGGNDAVPGSYPWHALLKLDGGGVCGASLLNEFWLITGMLIRYPGIRGEYSYIRILPK